VMHWCCHKDMELGITTYTTAAYTVTHSVSLLVCVVIRSLVVSVTDTSGALLSVLPVSYCVAQTQSTVGTMTLYMVHHPTHSNILLLCKPQCIPVGVMYVPPRC